MEINNHKVQENHTENAKTCALINRGMTAWRDLENFKQDGAQIWILVGIFLLKCTLKLEMFSFLSWCHYYYITIEDLWKRKLVTIDTVFEEILPLRNILQQSWFASTTIEALLFIPFKENETMSLERKILHLLSINFLSQVYKYLK